MSNFVPQMDTLNAMPLPRNTSIQEAPADCPRDMAYAGPLTSTHTPGPDGVPVSPQQTACDGWEVAHLAR